MNVIAAVALRYEDRQRSLSISPPKNEEKMARQEYPLIYRGLGSAIRKNLVVRQNSLLEPSVSASHTLC